LRQGAGESELHAVRNHARRLREAVRNQNHCHLAEISGENQADAARRNYLSRRPRRKTGDDGKTHGFGDGKAFSRPAVGMGFIPNSKLKTRSTI
jgi:hypothetical protein